jgi:hypothetical protein
MLAVAATKGLMKKLYIYIATSFVLAALLSYFLFFKESSFQECVLNHVKNSPEDSASLIYKMCEEKYDRKSKKQATFDLNPFQLTQVTGRAGLLYQGSDRFRGNLYNGNEAITIAEIEIAVTAKTKKSEGVTREYKTFVNIPPKTANDFGFNIIVGDLGSEYSWSLVSARGYANQ